MDLEIDAGKALVPRFNPIDLLTLGFITLNILIVLFGWSRIEGPGTAAMGYLTTMIVTLGIILIGTPKHLPGFLSQIEKPLLHFWGYVRGGYPFLFLAYFFVTVTEIDNIFYAEALDPWFRAMEKRIFGYLPHETLMDTYDNYWVSEILHGAYFIYYVLLGVLPYQIYKRSPESLQKYTFAAMTVFYASALTYLIFPVIGGRYTEEMVHKTLEMRYGFFTRLMASMYRTSNHFGAAFPSTHTAQSLVLAVGALVYLPMKKAWIYSLNGVLVLLATVYGGYHYILDVVGGFLYFGAFFPLGLKFYDLWFADLAQRAESKVVEMSAQAKLETETTK
ncbi:MAG: phosphatase PAP2 family protein [Spirochaetales bacterium]|nr:phosphatase PAP2 family protein [Spirochaetales bacterium]